MKSKTESFLICEASQRLFERLEWMKISPRFILQLNVSTEVKKLLADRFPETELISAEEFLTSEKAEKKIDLIFSVLSDEHPKNFQKTFEKLLTFSVPGALFLSVFFGPDTLKEWRKIWLVEDEWDHVTSFADMHDVGDALLQAGFIDPVMDVETVKLMYSSVEKFCLAQRELKWSKETMKSRPGLIGKKQWARICAAYEKMAQSNERLPATIEFVTATAWAPIQSKQKKDAEGNAVFYLENLNFSKKYTERT